MKHFILSALAAILTTSLMAVPCPERIQASAGSGTVSTNSSGGGSACNASTTLIVCEDEDISLRYHPSDAGVVFGAGYQFHSFTATNIYTNTTQSFGLFLNNAWQDISLSVGTYDITATYSTSTSTYLSAKIRVKVIAVDIPLPTLSAGPYCVGQSITVTGEKNYTFTSDYTTETINMGDGTILTPNVFGGGQPWNPSFEQISTTHSYSTPGEYTITISRTFPCGVRTASTTIVVGPQPVIVLPPAPCAGNSLPFMMNTPCQSYIDPGTILWNFGDGSFSSLPNPTHIYTGTGGFDVTLSFNVNGTSYMGSQYLIVNPSPTVNLGPDQSFCPNGFFIWPTLDAGGSGMGYTYSWTFNGNPIEGATGQYVNTGDWGVYCVTVTNEQGCSTTDCMEVAQKPLFAPIDPNFNISLNSSGCSFFLSVYPNDTRYGLYHQWYIYKNQPAGTTNGGVLDAAIVGTSWGGGNQLPYTFQGGTWYWIKAGVYSDCDPWTEKRQAYYWSCKTGELTELSEEEVAQVSIYPNPASDIVHLTGFSGQIEVQLFTMDGRLMKRYNEVASDGLPVSFDVADMDAGVYLIQVTDEFGNASSDQLIIE